MIKLGNILLDATVTLSVLMIFATSCSSDVEPTVPDNGKTVLVYMAGRNDLTSFVSQDLREMKDGSCRITDDDCLLVFVRNYDVMPWIARIKGGEVTDSVSLKDIGITNSDGSYRASDPAVMEGVLRYAFSHYPSREEYYGLVLWGHSSGWILEREMENPGSRGYGRDDQIWINMPTMAAILKKLPHLKFILADCCNFMCLENLYELRQSCDYIIGSPAEISSVGAPYDLIVPDLFNHDSSYKILIDKIFQNTDEAPPMVVARMSGMDDLAKKTRLVLKELNDSQSWGTIDLTGLIHYGYRSPIGNIFFDAGDFIRTYTTDELYRQWCEELDKVIIRKHLSSKWKTSLPWDIYYADILVTSEKMHGLSMFLPNSSQAGSQKYFLDLHEFEWYSDVWKNE